MIAFMVKDLADSVLDFLLRISCIAGFDLSWHTVARTHNPDIVQQKSVLSRILDQGEDVLFDQPDVHDCLLFQTLQDEV